MSVGNSLAAYSTHVRFEVAGDGNLMCGTLHIQGAIP